VVVVLAVPLASMEKKRIACIDESATLEDECQLRFKEKFFPDVPTPTLGALLNVCSFYTGVPEDVTIMKGVRLKNAQKYAHENNTTQSEVFMRFANVFMVRAYNPYFFKEKVQERINKLQSVVATIEADNKLMSYILTGDKNEMYNPHELMEKLHCFKRTVDSYLADEK
jgi:hypothetical protein